MKKASRLSLNVAPVDVPNVNLAVTVYPYDPVRGHEDLADLRKRLRPDYAVARRHDRIVCVPRVAGLGELDGVYEQLPLRENLSLAGALLSEALIDHFRGLGTTVVGHRPVAFAGRSDRDLLASSLPTGLDLPSWLSILPKYELDVRLFFLGGRDPFLGVAIDCGTRRIIAASCDLLVQQGFPIEGLYVGRRAPSEDSRLDWQFKLGGRVVRVRGDFLELEDHVDGLETLALRDAFLEPSSHSLRILLDHLFGDRAGDARAAAFNAPAIRRMGPNKLKDLHRTLKHLREQEFEVAPGVRVAIGEFLTAADIPRLSVAQKPTYVFDPTGEKTYQWADGGIQKYGPYSQQTFSKNRPRVAVICQASTKGRVEQFVRKLLHGQRHPKRDPGPFDDGLIQKYRLTDVVPQFFLADQATADAYRRAAEAAVSEDSRWDLALVQIDERHRQLPAAENPYWVTKHVFLAHQTPTQEFALETASLWEGQLAYALNNMALATYAKLGGTPWLLKSDRSIAHELVVGIGNATIGMGRLGGRERVVGFTTVFSGDGEYRIANSSKAVPFDQYAAELEKALTSTIETVSKDMNWQPNDHVRLIFHAFKPFRDVEAKAVKTLVSTLVPYDVDYAFLELSQRHPYVLFDESQPGVRDFETKKTKGILAPQRGQMLLLSKSEALVVLTGPSDVKRPEDGLPSPVLLRLHRESTFEDLTYLTRQVFAFAHHSWRSFFPGSLPVTVHYSELIAELLGELSRLPNWNPDVLWGRIGRSRWFL